jgi:hypothetical protein
VYAFGPFASVAFNPTVHGCVAHVTAAPHDDDMVSVILRRVAWAWLGSARVMPSRGSARKLAL